MKVFIQPRQSGKTRKLIRNIDGYQCLGLIKLWIVAPNWDMLSAIFNKAKNKNINVEYSWIRFINSNSMNYRYNVNGFFEPDHILVDECFLINETFMEDLIIRHNDKITAWGSPSVKKPKWFKQYEESNLLDTL